MNGRFEENGTRRKFHVRDYLKACCQILLQCAQVDSSYLKYLFIPNRGLLAK